jgi:hypothetical protein
MPEDWKNDPNTWLSNFNIEAVLIQYEDEYKPFYKFFGVYSADFLRKVGNRPANPELFNINIQDLYNMGVRTFGFVINLDDHDEPGSHWVSLFIDIDNKYIFYFDSADNEIPPEIWQKKVENGTPLVNRIIEQGKENSIDFTFYNNRGHEHQKSNTECGMYSLFFIITLLTGETSFTEGLLSVEERRNLFIKKRIPDKTVFGYRRLYFND